MLISDKKWYDKLFNVKYLPLFHHFKAIYQFPKLIIFWVKILDNASLNKSLELYSPHKSPLEHPKKKLLYEICCIHMLNN
jgi:hypothetical protein